VIPKRLARKGLPLLAAVALLAGPLAISAQAEPSGGGPAQPTVNPAALGLSHGHHVLTLQGMLITTTASFRS
jgi:hypothetical protein